MQTFTILVVQQGSNYKSSYVVFSYTHTSSNLRCGCFFTPALPFYSPLSSISSFLNLSSFLSFPFLPLPFHLLLPFLHTLPFPSPFSQDPDNSCEDGDIQLADGKTKNEGRLEICFENHWGTVCDDGFSNTDASVVCRQLGLEPNGTCIYMYRYIYMYVHMCD